MTSRRAGSIPAVARGLEATPFAHLHATPPARLPYQADVLVRSFVLERAAGTVVVYNSPGVSDAMAGAADNGRASSAPSISTALQANNCANCPVATSAISRSVELSETVAALQSFGSTSHRGKVAVRIA